MQIRAALEGDLRKIMDREVAVLKAGVRVGMTSAADSLKEKLRAQVRGAGMPQSIQKAWQTKTYPKKDSMNAASWVYSKAPRIHSAFDAGGTIVPSRSNGWLVIPLPAAIQMKLHTSPKLLREGVRGKERASGTATRWSDVEAAEQRFGSLRWVKLSGGRALLVADHVTASGRRRRVRQTREGGAVQGIGNVSMPLFLLVRRVRLGKRLDIDSAVAQSGRDFMGHLLAGIAAAEQRSRR